MNAEIQARVRAATVRVSGGGLGVFVPGGFVLTAAHCVTWVGTGDMALASDEYLESITTATNVTFPLNVWAVEPVSDMAVLSEPDTQQLFDECERFWEWSAETSPIEIWTDLLAHGAHSGQRDHSDRFNVITPIGTT